AEWSSRPPDRGGGPCPVPPPSDTQDRGPGRSRGGGPCPVPPPSDTRARGPGRSRGGGPFPVPPPSDTPRGRDRAMRSWSGSPASASRRRGGAGGGVTPRRRAGSGPGEVVADTVPHAPGGGAGQVADRVGAASHPAHPPPSHLPPEGVGDVLAGAPRRAEPVP